MLDQLKSLAFSALSSPRGNFLPPVRWTKGLLLFLNHMAGQPLASREDLAARHAAPTGAAPPPANAKAAPEQAPVMIYKDWNSRFDLKRITDVLSAAGIAWKELDVTEDEATRSWVKLTAGVDDLPAVYIAGDPVGGFQEIVQLDVSGELKRRTFSP